MFAFLARLIVFLIAVSVIRGVVEYIKRLWSGSPQPRPVFRAPNTGGTAQPTSATSLQQDPICGTYVAVDTSLKKIIAGRVYHFCSAECRNRFTA
ncbi:MAG: hypothetical protein ABUS49_12275 [Acidobacteriota bacterium]